MDARSGLPGAPAAARAKHGATVATLMAFTHNGYTLHAREVELKGGHKQVIYFFSQRSPKSGIPVEMPQGYALAVNKRTGLPYLRRLPSA